MINDYILKVMKIVIATCCLIIASCAENHHDPQEDIKKNLIENFSPKKDTLERTKDSLGQNILQPIN